MIVFIGVDKYDVLKMMDMNTAYEERSNASERSAKDLMN